MRGRTTRDVVKRDVTAIEETAVERGQWSCRMSQRRQSVRAQLRTVTELHRHHIECGWQLNTQVTTRSRADSVMRYMLASAAVDGLIDLLAESELDGGDVADCVACSLTIDECTHRT